MRGRLLLLGVLLPLAAQASDAPHDPSSLPAVNCDSCHMLHKAPGASLTHTAGNANLCASCHSGLGIAAFMMPASAQAQPGAMGSSHRFDSAAVNPTYGATTPVDPLVSSRIPGGNLQCSTCHDQHLGASTVKGRQRTSVAVGTPILRTGGAGSGTLVLNQPLAAANAKGYRVEVVTAGAVGSSTFRVSNDNGISWFSWAGGWSPGVGAGQATGSAVALTDGNNVTVTFAGTFAVGDRWNFYVSYPFLRMKADESQLCETCHTGRVQTTASIETGADGTKVFSHPIGESLSKSYDRAANAILDSDGHTQTVGDGLATNDLELVSSDGGVGVVRCLTCHAPHHADSNSLTEDPR